MIKHALYAALISASLAEVVWGQHLPLNDSAFVRSGLHADVAQDAETALVLKNAGGDYCRIAMIKADTSSITQRINTATFSFYAKDTVPHSIYVYGVKDSAGFQNWTGGDTGTATWNSVSANGLFQPGQDLYLNGDPDLVLLGSVALPGTNTGDVQVAVSGGGLTSLLNNDTDGLLTFVFATDANENGLAVRPHNHDNTPALEAAHDSTIVIIETIGPTGIRHPGCLQSAAEINALALALAEDDPYRNQLWTDMMNNTRGRIDKTNWIPPTDLFGTDFASPAKYSGAGLIRYINDWIINGSTSSEAAAITILDSWAGVQSFTPDPADPLKHHRLVSMWLGYLAHAADLLISSGTSWPQADQQAFKDTVRNILLPIANEDRAASFNGNWDAGATWAVMAMAVLLDDKDLFDEQIAWLKTGATNARITNYLLSSGQCQESSRDQTHASMGLTFLSLAIQTAWTQGEDLYEYNNRSLGRAFEYLAAYNLDEDHLPYQVYPAPLGTSDHGFNLNISAISRPTYFEVYEMVYHHYKNYRGIELPYCKHMLETVTRPEEPGPNWSNHNSALYWNLAVGNATNLGADAALAVNSNYAGRAYVRLDCGGESYYMASDGRAFTKERNEWNDGGSNGSHANPVAGTTEDALYQTFRLGNTSGSIYYHFALTNGEYRVKLHFAEPDFNQSGDRLFNVYIEGGQVLSNFDIFSHAGKNTATIHETIVTLTDGQLSVELESVQNRPIISAIEIEPTLPTPYSAWAASYGLTGTNTAYGVDYDADGLNNLGEYALGGNPTNHDVAVWLPIIGTGVDNGTNWFNYVSRRRLDAAARGLNYDVLVTTNLADGIWTNNTEEAGSTAIDAEFESVTNRVSIDSSTQQFLKLETGIHQ